jgi:hypothetical protein
MHSKHPRMRLSSFFALTLALPLSLAAQNLPYDLTVLSQPYASLVEATVLSPFQYDGDEGWDDPTFSAPLGFTFDMAGTPIAELTQYGVGCLMMGLTFDPKSGSPLLHGVIPTNYDLSDRAINGGEPSIIQWSTTGAPGSQIFTIEWANAGLYDEVFGPDTVTFSYVNLQVRLFETDNSIEYHYGPSDIAEAITAGEPQVSGLLLNVDTYSYFGNIVALGGNPSQPNMTMLSSLDDWYYGPVLDSYPTDGTVYRFGPTGLPLGTIDSQGVTVTLSPNPTTDMLNVQFAGQQKWEVLDLSGRVMLSGTDQDGVRIDMTPLSAGTYLFALEGATIQQVIRQ